MTRLKLSRIGVLGHPKRPQTVPVAEHITQSLQEHGIEAWCYTVWEEDDVTADVQGSDMVIAIGGDGAMLHAARVCAAYGVPVLGVNMGRLGFLTEIAEVEEWESYLRRLLNDDYWEEERMMIYCELKREGQVIASGSAVNDVVISGTMAGSMVILDCYIDGYWTTTYNADALIVSTPTGASAYALASGGPILPPDLKNILVIPSAAHLSMDRPIVLSQGSQVAITPDEANRNETIVTLDGMLLAALSERDILYIRACDYSSRFVRMRERNYFYRSLLDRLEPRVNRNGSKEMTTLGDIEGQ